LKVHDWFKSYNVSLRHTHIKWHIVCFDYLLFLSQ
jgi:hypothetical protein